MVNIRNLDTRIPRKPFLWLTAALVFTVPPMFGTLAPWVPALFLGVLFAKFWMEPRDYRLRSPVWKLLLGVVVLAAVFVSYGSIRGIEPGVSIVVILMSLKILEAHSARELQVMVNVGWILCLCGFFLAQDLAIAMCVLIAAVLLVVALIEFHQAPSTSSIWPPLRMAGKMALQAVPLLVLLFVLFPRINFGLRLQFTGTQSAGSGFSGELSPGSVSSLANSSAIAFRAELPDGQIPRPDALYWRGAALAFGDGMRWRAPAAPASLPRSDRPTPIGTPVRQQITIEPHNNHWMFALDRPGDAPAGSVLAPGNYLWSGQTIREKKKYLVTSFPGLAEQALRPRERRQLLDVPAGTNPAVRHLAESWGEGAAGPADIVRQALEYFHTQGFRYSLAPGEYRNTDVAEFLFSRRIGFCEHYAAAFATLMRLAGIPARVVVGYLGGEYNELGHFFVVRQSDSHAWCEVWLDQKGWIRVDPTSVVAPDRLTLGLNGFLENRTVSASGINGNGLVRGLARSSMFNQVRLAWQAVNYAWDTRVLSFDEAAQVSFLNALTAVRFDPVSLGIGGVALLLIVLAIYAGCHQFRARTNSDRLKILYDRFCDKLARLGAVREATEGPAAFAARASQLLPGRSQQINQISYTYITLRYSGGSARFSQTDLKHAVNAF